MTQLEYFSIDSSFLMKPVSLWMILDYSVIFKSRFSMNAKHTDVR